MGKGKGFTLVELMAVVAIIGILALTAVPLYRTMQQRTYGREASLMAKHILDGQIAYLLANDKFFPEPTETLEIYADGRGPSSENIKAVKEALNIEIPTGHFLDYHLFVIPAGDGKPERFAVQIQAPFPLFQESSSVFTNEGATVFQAYTDRNGNMEYAFLH